MNARWTLCNGPIRLRVAESARRDGVLVAVTCGDGAGSMPDLGFGEGDAAASPKDRRRLADAVGVEPGRLVFMQQVHGGQVAAVDASRAGAGLHCRGDAVAAADAMTTTSAAVALVALSADCPLVALWDARARTVAVAHAGWRGLAAGVLPHTVAALVGLGADAGRMAAAVGPAIGPCCYEVGRDVADELLAAGAVLPEHVLPRGTSLHLDLPGAVRHQLLAAGLAADRIDVEPSCTMCSPGVLHSYRRDGRRAGRQAMVVRLQPCKE
ncbi:MAG: peptidoglycan editing factor PgeF [Phycisphaerae bacterium]|nr:peptidoglycan editing factor PgeF [Phycisphaerae bacterium]